MRAPHPVHCCWRGPLSPFLVSEESWPSILSFVPWSLLPPEEWLRGVREVGGSPINGIHTGSLLMETLWEERPQGFSTQG